MSIYPKWFRRLQKIVRFFARKMDVRGADRVTEPCVLITRHLNNYGPFAVYLYSPFEFHMWSYYVFFDPEICSRHLSEFTFSKRAGMPPWMAKLCARIVSHPIAWLYRTLKMIPVYRGLKSVMETMNRSTDMLEKGENVLIMTDVNYAAEGKDIGEIYTGFLHLGKLYFKRTGKRLNFVPLSLNRREGYFRLGEPIEFDPTVPFQQEKERIASRLVQELADDY